VRGGPYVARGPEVAQACYRMFFYTNKIKIDLKNLMVIEKYTKSNVQKISIAKADRKKNTTQLKPCFLIWVFNGKAFLQGAYIRDASRD